MLSKITFSREPAVYIGLISALLVAIIQSGVSPDLSANAGAYSTLIALLAGVAIRFFVTPTASKPAAASAVPAAPAPPVVPPAA